MPDTTSPDRSVGYPHPASTTRDSQGLLHSIDDQPAIVRADGTRVWLRHGDRHRDHDQPALIRPDGTRIWYQNGVIHRDGDQPAIVRGDGTRAWYQHGLMHRDVGPAQDNQHLSDGLWARHGTRPGHDFAALLTTAWTVHTITDQAADDLLTAAATAQTSYPDPAQWVLDVLLANPSPHLTDTWRILRAATSVI
jgi:hypothetical protein